MQMSVEQRKEYVLVNICVPEVRIKVNLGTVRALVIRLNLVRVQ